MKELAVPASSFSTCKIKLHLPPKFLAKPSELKDWVF